MAAIGPWAAPRVWLSKKIKSTCQWGKVGSAWTAQWPQCPCEEEIGHIGQRECPTASPHLGRWIGRCSSLNISLVGHTFGSRRQCASIHWERKHSDRAWMTFNASCLQAVCSDCNLSGRRLEGEVRDGSWLATNIDCWLHSINCQRGKWAGEGDGQKLFPSCQAVDATHLMHTWRQIYLSTSPTPSASPTWSREAVNTLARGAGPYPQWSAVTASEWSEKVNLCK